MPENKDIYDIISQLHKVEIISNNVCYGSILHPDDEVEQHLSILKDGRVSISRYKYGLGEYEKISIENFKIKKETVIVIFSAIMGCLNKEYYKEMITDIGSWEMNLTYSDGKDQKFVGALFSHSQFNSLIGKVSDLIRRKLGKNDLFVFDGNANQIDCIQIDYHRNTKVKTHLLYKADSEYTSWDYTEQLTIDRKSETIKYVQNIGKGCKVTHTYYIQEGISNFLDNVYHNVFTEIKGNPPDVYNNPLDVRDYTIKVFTKFNRNRVISGTFDKNGLPTDWPEFMEELYNFISFYGFLGEMFDEKLYLKVKRRQNEIIFCKVVFEENGKKYCYIADTDEYCVGDLVVVPAGIDNHEEIVRIESIEYHTEEDAPYPLDKIKRIIRKCTKEDFL